MKTKNIIICTISSIILTFIVAEIFSLYHFGDIPTLLTTFYLISIFSIILYILISCVYIIRKIINHEKLLIKDLIGRFLFFISLLIILIFIVVLNIDWINWYLYSSPFYINVIERVFEFIVPAIILIIIGVKLLRKN